MHERFDEASDDFRFTAAVTEFAEILRRSKHSEGARLSEVEELAGGANPDGVPGREEFRELVQKASQLWP